MTQTIFITGASSGIGKETALHFAEHDWNVVAAMRNPRNRKTDLHENQNIRLVHLDMSEPSTIQGAFEKAFDSSGRIDVLVNNPGYTVFGALEASTRENISQQFEANVLGLFIKI